MSNARLLLNRYRLAASDFMIPSLHRPLSLWLWRSCGGRSAHCARVSTFAGLPALGLLALLTQLSRELTLAFSWGRPLLFEGCGADACLTSCIKVLVHLLLTQLSRLRVWQLQVATTRVANPPPQPTLDLMLQWRGIRTALQRVPASRRILAKASLEMALRTAFPCSYSHLFGAT